MLRLSRLRRLCGTLLVASLLWLSTGQGFAATPVSVAKASNGTKVFVIGDKVFVPIGVNYLIDHLGAPYQSFDMFDTKTFNIERITKNLTEISDDGYNVVRLWLKGFDPDEGFGLGPDQVSDAYADNVLATIEEARRLGLHVILTGAFKVGLWLPKNYLPSGPLPGEDVVGGSNRLLLIPQMAEAAGLFYHDLLAKIAAKDPAALDSIFYFDLYCELHFDLHQPPLSATSGAFEFAGKSYDLGSAASRQALMDKAGEAWMSTVSAKVKAVDPRMLTTASSFFVMAIGHRAFDGGVNARPGVKPAPYPVRPAAMLKGGASLLDLHFYPSPPTARSSGFHDRIDGIMRAESISADAGYPLPLIAGEFGETESQLFSRADALTELKIVRDTMCRYHFLGYVVWSWNPPDRSSLPIDEDLEQAVAPKFAPRFCGSQT